MSDAIAGWAVVDLDRPGAAGVLMLVDEREEADAIAFELRRKGLRVEVVAIPAERGR